MTMPSLRDYPEVAMGERPDPMPPMMTLPPPENDDPVPPPPPPPPPSPPHPGW